MSKKRVPIQNIVLRTLLLTGVIGVALVAPNAARLFANIDAGKTARKRLYRRIDQARWRLERKGLVHVSGHHVELTSKGKKHIASVFDDGYRVPEPVFWDGKWRIVLFDVREERRRARNILRKLLHAAGFLHLQDSVWVFPYPCDEFVELLRGHLRSGVGEMLFITADSFAGDRRLRAEFSLP